MSISDADAINKRIGQARQRLQLARSDSRGETEVSPWLADAHERAPEARFDIDLLRYWSVLFKHRLLVLCSILASVAVALAVTLMMRPIYTAQATVQIDREADKVVNIQNVRPDEGAADSDQFYQTQYGLLRSRSLAERVVATLGLDKNAGFLASIGTKQSGSSDGPNPQPSRRFHEAVLSTVMSNLGVTPVNGSKLVKLTYDNRSPTIAATIANGFVDQFIQANLQRRFEASSYARSFLQDQIQVAKAKLDDSERAAVQYAIDQQIVVLHDANGQPGAAAAPTLSLVDQRLSAMDMEYSAAQAARIDAEAKWQQAANAQGIGLSQILDDATVQQLTQEKAKLEAEYEDEMRLFRPGYPPALQLRAQINELDKKIQGQVSAVKAALHANYASALSRERQLASQVNGLKSNDLDEKQRSIKYDLLLHEVDTSRALYEGLLQRYKEVGVTAAAAPNNISIVDKAESPLSPSKPKLLLNLAVGFVFGIGFGALGAFGAEALDQAIRHPQDIETEFGVPLLGVVPLLAKGVRPQEAMLDLRSTFWESYYSIRTALQFSSSSGVPHSMVVVSARPGEGKTTTSVALAFSLARIGAKVLLVDADLRKPSLHSRFNLDPRIGLSNFLTGANNFSELLQASELPSLSMITSGPLPPTPAELLADVRFKAFLAEARHFDVLIFDGPPVMGFADAPLIASAVDGALVVVESGATGKVQLRSALRRLRMANAKILGVVLEKYDVRKASQGYGYGYGYTYYAYDYGTNVVAEQQKRVS